MDFGGGDQIRFERTGKAGIVTLTRPKALNALTHRMVKALSAALTAWENDRGVEVVILKAEGRAFCAGGDILEVYKAWQEGKRLTEFFADEYRLNAQIDRFKKPYVSLIDGICMGGGMGISAHGSHRVMTENAVFAMPEVGLGFFPDVGGSYLLPNLGSSFGMYLGLTGNKIEYGDALWSGIATHTVEAAYLPAIAEEIAESGDPGGELREFFRAARRKTDEACLHAIAKHFSLGSLTDIVASLDRAARIDQFAADTLATIRSRSPTSLHVTFRAITVGSTMSMDECMKMEFRILNRMLESHDLYEGIRAALIEKGSVPNWQPARLEEVGTVAVDAYFAPLPEGELSAVTDLAERGPMRPTLTEQAFVWFQRLIAGYCLLFGILYWVRLIGVYDGPLWRFDLMPVHWQVAAVTLSVFFPFAAIGLWMLASWGPVIWVICAVTETAMYFFFPDLYGHRLLIVSSHLAVALFYTAFRLLIHWQRRRAER